MSGWFGKKEGQGNNPWQGAGNGSGRGSGSRGVAWRATVLVVLSVLAAWLMSGLFVLKANQQAAIFRLGQFHRMARAGLNWTLPYPLESHEITNWAESGSTVIGDAATVPQSGLQSLQLLTADGAVVEVRLLAQYRIRDISSYVLTQTQDAEQLLKLAGAAAVRQVLAGMTLAAVIEGDIQQMARRVQAPLQAALDAAQSGIEITSLTAAANAVRVPQAVQATYAQITQLQAEKAQAAAQAASAAAHMLAAAKQEVAHMQDEAQAYKKQVIAEAQAESEQFAAVLPEYQKAPQAVRDRLYYDSMQHVFGKMNKVVVDQSSGQTVHISLGKPDGVAAPGQAASGAAGSASASGGAVVAAGAASGAGAAVPARGSAPASAAAANPSRTRDPDVLRQRR